MGGNTEGVGVEHVGERKTQHNKEGNMTKIEPYKDWQYRQKTEGGTKMTEEEQQKTEDEIEVEDKRRMYEKEWVERCEEVADDCGDGDIVIWGKHKFPVSTVVKAVDATLWHTFLSEEEDNHREEGYILSNWIYDKDAEERYMWWTDDPEQE